MNILSIVEQPVSGQSYYRQHVPVEGWLFADYRHDRIKRIAAYGPGGELGSTCYLFPRDDVTQSQRLPAGTRSGFRFIATFPNPYIQRTTVGIEVRVEFTDGSYVPLSGIHVGILENDYTGGPYGSLCNPRQTELLHREHIYSTGEPASTASPECVQLLANYLPTGISLIDVGCGIGAYCEPLRSRGFSWIGCETSLECLHGLALHSRPHRRIRTPFWPWSKYRLPAADGEFDAAIAIEVLEHVREPDAFLREMARVTKRYACFSVPNLETLPYLAPRLVAPWHILEGDHRNFFTRFNLAPLLKKHFRSVEVLDYGQQSLKSMEDLPLPYHLFALCEK